jgi:1-acyl-sn-glycerol-3-phosphate acyltransferase
MEEEKDIGYVFEAEEPSWLVLALAVATLGFVFFLALFYSVIVGLMLWLWYMHEMTWVFWLVLFLVASMAWGGMLVTLSGGFCYESGWLDCLVLRAWRAYFQLRVYKEREIPRDKRVLFTAFPHGMFPLALPILGGIGKEILPELETIPKIAIAEKLFNIPLLAPLLYWVGCISADREPMRKALEEGTCLLMPDGIAGIYHSSRDEEVLYIKKRRGFFQLALETGSLLVPVYCFGHTQLFSVYPNKHTCSWLVDLSRRMGFALTFFIGHASWIPFLPRRDPLLVVMGRPFECPYIPEPSERDIEELRVKYIERVQTLFDVHAKKHGWENKELIIE